MHTLISEVWLFIQLVFTTWEGYVSGGVIVLILTFYERWKRRNIPWSIFKWGALVFLVVSFFVVWRKEHHFYLEAKHDVPDLRLQIDEVGVGRTKEDPDDPDSNMFVVANLTNLGTPSVADEWSLIIQMSATASRPARRVTAAPSLMRPESKITFQSKSGDVLNLTQKDSLYDKAIEKPIEKGAKLRGILVFSLLGVGMADVGKDGTILQLQCKDVMGNVVTAPYTISMKRGTGGRYQHFPGLTPPEVPKQR